MQFANKRDRHEGEDQIGADLNRAKHDDIPINDAALVALDMVGEEDARVPVDSEGATLGELEDGLDDEGEDEDDHDDAEEEAPVAGFVLEAVEQAGDGELDEGHGEVPDDLVGEEEFEGGAPAGEADEGTGVAEAVDNGEGVDDVVYYGEDLYFLLATWAVTLTRMMI